MKLTLQIQLLPDARQEKLLLNTMKAFNAAANYAAKVGFEAKKFSQINIHKLCYYDLRKKFNLSAQMAVRAIGKTIECFKINKKICPTIKPFGAMTYDQRLMSFKGLDKVSLLTLEGRELIPFIMGEYQTERFDRIKGQCDLVYREQRFKKHENHVISKQIVRLAKDTGRGIALENLKGIRDRTRFRKSQRARMGGWSFFQ